MAKLLDGKQVITALSEKLKADVSLLNTKNITPTLAMVRVGERKDDISYERGATKRCETIGVAVKNFVLSSEASQDELLSIIDGINKDKDIHGCLLFRPLPKHINDNIVRNRLSPAKDVDGITDISLSGVFAGIATGFPPCTPQACMEILDYFNIETTGKNAVVIGRSLVVGKPAAMMLIQKNATATICHTKTTDMPTICRQADILIVAAGRAEIIGKEYFRDGQIVIDVGINVDEKGKLCGDVNFAEAEPIVEAITPVPGGVGTVTTSVLVKHVIEAAKLTQER